MLLAGGALAVLASPASAQSALAQSTDASPETKAGEVASTIVVIGRKIDGYVAKDALTGTKNAALLEDLPLSVQVISDELLEDRGVVRIGDALDTVSGAQRISGYAGGPNFGLILRGFDTNNINLRNGYRDAGFLSLRDVANVHRFEILKGPASVLYGTLSPGGVTNTITKKAANDTFLDANFYAGSHDFYRGEIDGNAALSDDFQMRVNVAFEDNDSHRDLVHNQSIFVSPTATWQITDRLRWIGEMEYKKSDFTWDLGLPLSPISLEVPVNRFLGEEDGVNHVNSLFLSSSLSFQLTDNWDLRQNIALSRTDGEYNIRTFTGIRDDGRTVERQAYYDDENSRTFVVQHEAAGNFEVLGLENDVVFGYEYYEAETDFIFEVQDFSDIDLFEPVYGYEAGSLFQFPLFGNKPSSRAHGVYLQNLISIGTQIKLLVGGRFDTVRSKNQDLLAGIEVLDKSDSAFSPQVGLVYQPDDKTSLYGNFSTSFSPVTFGRFRDGDPKPERGKQFEIGIKRTFLDDRMSATLAAFSITKQNVATSDPSDPLFSIQTGEQKSRGVELDVNATVFEGLSLTAAGAYTDAFVSEDTNIPAGSQLVGVPKWSGNIFARYSVQGGPLRGLRLGGGVFYSGERSAALPNPDWNLPSYTRVDALVGYAFGNWDIQLNLNNLTDDKIYFMNGRVIAPQAGRTFLLRLGAGF